MATAIDRHLNNSYTIRRDVGRAAIAAAEVEADLVVDEAPIEDAIFMTFSPVEEDQLHTGKAICPLCDGPHCIMARIGIDDCVVFAAASHTHFAPAVDPGKPRLGQTDPDFCASFIEKARGLVDTLFAQSPKAGRIRYGRGLAAHSVNRRRPGWKPGPGLRLHREVLMRPNFQGPNDQTLHLLRFETSDELVAVMWCWACHPVSFPHPHQVSSEFPGVVRSSLRREHHPELPVLFLQGFSGDIRPPSVASKDVNPLRWIDALLNGPRFGFFSEAAYREWTESLSSSVIQLAKSSTLQPFQPALHTCRKSLSLSEVIDGNVDGRRLEVIQLVLAEGLQLLGFTAEMVTEYVSHIDRLFPQVVTIPVGCVGSVFGYLPTDRMLADGGYEAGGHFPMFSLEGNFKSSVEPRIVELLRELQE
jgi:hypothetical protein